MYFSVLSAPNPRMTSFTGVPKSHPPHPPIPPLPRHHFGVKRVISPGKRGPKMGENGGEMRNLCICGVSYAQLFASGVGISLLRDAKYFSKEGTDCPSASQYKKWT